MNLAAIAIGSMVWKTDDPQLRQRMEQSFARDVVVHREPVDFSISGSIGGPVSLWSFDKNQRPAKRIWPGPLEAAQKHPMTLEVLHSQLGRLGDTPFELADIKTSCRQA